MVDYKKLMNEKPFCLLVAGTRTYSDYQELCNILDHLLSYLFKNKRRIRIVSDGAKGADALAERYTDERGFEKVIMPADWDKYGKSAGYKRNAAMHHYISFYKDRGCVCFWDGRSKGTQHNFTLSKEGNTPLRVFNFVKKQFVEVN